MTSWGGVPSNTHPPRVAEIPTQAPTPSGVGQALSTSPGPYKQCSNFHCTSHKVLSRMSRARGSRARGGTRSVAAPSHRSRPPLQRCSVGRPRIARGQTAACPESTGQHWGCVGSGERSHCATPECQANGVCPGPWDKRLTACPDSAQAIA